MQTSHTKIVKINPTFSQPEILRAWTEPLTLLNIPYFCYVNIDDNYMMSFFCNYPEFGRHYLDNGYYQYDIHMAKNLRTPQVMVWDLFERTEKSKIMHDAFREFGRAHTITFVQPRKNSCDYFHFATYPGDLCLHDTYLKRLDVLEQYISFFRDKLSRNKKIRESLMYRLKLDAQTGGYMTPTEPLDTNVDLFRQAIQHKRIFSASDESYLTPYESQCMHWLSQGKTTEETAIILGISPRTVRAHIENAKSKTGAVNLFQLGMKYKAFS